MSNLETLRKQTLSVNKQVGDTPGIIDPSFMLTRDINNLPLNGKAFLKVHFDAFNASSIASTTIGALVDAALNKQIFAYKNNRGSGKTKEAWVLEKTENFYPDGLQTISLLDYGHNRYGLIEGHNRMQTLLYMRQTGQLRKYEHLTIPVQIVRKADEFMEVYRATNANHGHSIKDKLTNSDYGFGREISNFLKIVDNVNYRGVQIVKAEHVKQIALLLYGTTIKGETPSFKELIRYTSEVTQLANLLPNEFDIRFPTMGKSDLKDAFNFTLNVMKEVVELTDLKEGRSEKASISKIGQYILSSAMFFSLLTWDRFTEDGGLTEIESKKIAKRLVDKGEWTSQTLSLLSSKKSMDSAIQSFYEIIRTRKGSA